MPPFDRFFRAHPYALFFIPAILVGMSLSKISILDLLLFLYFTKARFMPKFGRQSKNAVSTTYRTTLNLVLAALSPKSFFPMKKAKKKAPLLFFWGPM